MPVKFVKIIAKVSEKYSSLNNKAAVLNVEKVDELMAVNWYCAIDQAKADTWVFTPNITCRSALPKQLNGIKQKSGFSHIIQTINYNEDKYQTCRR